MPGRIPPAFIDDLLARVDIVDVIEEYVTLKKGTRDHQALCPFHNEKTPSFTVSQPKQFYYCFGCGATGSALGFLMNYANLDFVSAVKDLADRVGLKVPETESDRPRQDVTPVYDQLQRAQQFFAQQLREHPARDKAVEYLKTRGLSGEIAASFGIGYAPPGWDNLLKALGDTPQAVSALNKAGMLIAKENGHYDRFRDRITFPILDQRGRVIGFGGRVLAAEEEPKYLNSPETPVFHKGRELYGLYQARQADRQLKRVFIVEGYTDVVSLAQFGVVNAVATLGTATTPEHLERLFRIVPEIVFCFDGDNAGRRAAQRAMETVLPQLRDGRLVEFQFLPSGEDPDSLVRKHGAQAFSAAHFTPLSSFLFEHLSAEIDLNTLDGRALMIDRARPLIGKVPEGAFRRLLTKKLGELTQLDAGETGSLIGPGARDEQRATPRKSSGGRQSPSLVRTAITLLIHDPQLAQAAPASTDLAALPIAGVPLLIELLDYLRAHPDSRSGAILEHFRGTESVQHLSKLLTAELTIPEAGREQEFSDALKRLLDQGRKLSTTALPTSPSELSDAEKAELRASLRPPDSEATSGE